MMQRLLGLFGLIGLTFSLTACSEPPYSNINNSQLKALVEQGVPLYDVRRPEEWRQTGVVAGSRKLTFVDGSGRLNPEFMPYFSANVAKDKPVILICRTGSRTKALSNELAAQGYTRIYNVRNGITGWLAENKPVVPN
jgi:rhodanese-related sulfurtransferase